MGIELRRATADDWEAWRPVRLRALADAPHAFGSTLQDWANAPEHRWRTRLSIPGALDLLAVDTAAEVPGTVVGMASGIPPTGPDGPDGPDGPAELISMWVDPAARGRGVARALIDAIAVWAATSGATELELSVLPDNAVARRAYERVGFSARDEPGDPLPDGRTEVRMRRTVAT